MPSDKNVFFVVLAWIHFLGWVSFVYETAQKKWQQVNLDGDSKEKEEEEEEETKNQNNSQQGYSIKSIKTLHSEDWIIFIWNKKK